VPCPSTVTTSIDNAFDARGELGVCLNIPAKNIAHGDVNEFQVNGKQFCLRSFAATLRPHNDVFVHSE